jgi:hypothetical protein
VHYIVGLARNPHFQGITEFLELAMKDEFERAANKLREVGELTI